MDKIITMAGYESDLITVGTTAVIFISMGEIVSHLLTAHLMFHN